MQIPEYIEVRSPTGSPVAYISPESDGLKECWPDINLNGTTTLSLSLPIGSDKWAYLTDENHIIAGGKEYVLLKPDAVELVRDGKKIWGKVVAQESWTLMGKQYATVSNDPTNPTPSWSQVSILSGGASAGGYSAGSAGSALTYLLTGSGWTLETCDVTGTHDLEMEKESLLACINKVQELWGGFLVWDSLNHTVSLRDETLLQNYTGFQIRYRKNEKTITKTVDNDITTRLYPFGADDLNISSVNSDALYLDNNTHTSRVLEGIYINQEITDPQELKDRAIKELAILCKPRINYKTSIIDLRTLPEWKHETFVCGDMADLIDEDVDTDERIRIIHYKYNLFQPWNCEIELGDPIKKIASTIADSTAVTNFFNSNVKPNISFQNILKAKIDSAATEINGATGGYTLIDGVSTWINPDDGSLVRITPKGLIISSDGGQTWKTAISGKGIFADTAWIGKINTGVIQIGAGTTFDSGYDPTVLKSYIDNTISPQIDGKIESWYQDTDPDTWVTADRTKHNGDMWYAPTAKLLKRYDGTNNTWTTIQDQAAISAYAAASTAQDAADGKRRVFTITPYPPYDVGDLWSGGSTGDLKRCKTAKATGQTYDATDWELATKYTDDTATNNLTNSLGNLAFEDVIEKARLGTTIIDGGHLKTELIQIGAGTTFDTGYDPSFANSNALMKQTEYDGVYISPDYGILCFHLDGSYTQIRSTGFKRFVSLGGASYSFHYRTYTGMASTTGGGSNSHNDMINAIVTLPYDFRGKDFAVTLSLKDTLSSSYPMYKIAINLVSVDQINGTFEVDAYVILAHGDVYIEPLTFSYVITY